MDTGKKTHKQTQTNKKTTLYNLCQMNINFAGDTTSKCGFELQV